MSDTSNRGRILFLVMTNRPDKLDVDLKRAGRLDRKIPFLYSQTPEEVENVARAQVRKNRIQTDVDFAAIRDGFSTKLVGYCNADVEAVILLANDDAARESGGEAAGRRRSTSRGPPRDYFPSRDVELLEYMELLAVFEASSRRLLPGEVRVDDAGGARRAAAAPAGHGRRAAVDRASPRLRSPAATARRRPAAASAKKAAARSRAISTVGEFRIATSSLWPKWKFRA